MKSLFLTIFIVLFFNGCVIKKSYYSDELRGVSKSTYTMDYECSNCSNDNYEDIIYINDDEDDVIYITEEVIYIEENLDDIYYEESISTPIYTEEIIYYYEEEL